MRVPSRSRQLTKISAPFITSPRSGPEDFAEREESFLDFIAVKHSKIPTIVRTEQLQEGDFSNTQTTASSVACLIGVQLKEFPTRNAGHKSKEAPLLPSNNASTAECLSAPCR